MSKEAFGSIAETGAAFGDRVKCVATDDPQRFLVGGIYTVIDFCGAPHVHGNSDYAGTNDTPGWKIPWRGYGAKWVKVPA